MSFEFLNILIKKFYPSLEGPRKGASPCSPKLGPYGNKCQFPEPYLAYPLGVPVKEPSLQVPLLELPHWEVLCFQIPFSFIFQSPWYMSPLPGSPFGPLWRKMPISRAVLYISFRVPSEGDLLQVPLTGLPKRQILCFQSPISNMYEVPGKWTPPPGFRKDPYGGRCPFPEPSTCKALVNEPPCRLDNMAVTEDLTVFILCHAVQIKKSCVI